MAVRRIHIKGCGRPPTENTVSRIKNPYQRAETVKLWREAAWVLWRRQANFKPGDQIGAVCYPTYKDKRSPQDVAACLPAFKAALDGAVDAGLLDDDKPEIVTTVTFKAGIVTGEDGLVVELSVV